MWVYAVAACFRILFECSSWGTENLGQDKVSQTSKQRSPEYEAWLTLELEYDAM